MEIRRYSDIRPSNSGSVRKSDYLDKIRVLWQPCLRKEREQAIGAFVEGNDVFLSLPTGYGKSLCFAMLPCVYDRLRQSEGNVTSIVVCVTPLQSLMVNQYERFSQVGLRVEFVGGCQEDDDTLIRVRDGQATHARINWGEPLLTVRVVVYIIMCTVNGGNSGRNLVLRLYSSEGYSWKFESVIMGQTHLCLV